MTNSCASPPPPPSPTSPELPPPPGTHDATSPPPPPSPRKSCLKVSTQTQSLESFCINDVKGYRKGFGLGHGRRGSYRLGVRVIAVMAFLDLLDDVREKRRKRMDDGGAMGKEDAPEKGLEGKDGVTDSSNPIGIQGGETKATEGAHQDYVIGSRVRYATVTIREYETSLVLNPGVSSGPAIGIGWNFVELPTVTVDEYETQHPVRQRLNKDAMRLSESERLTRLKESGYTDVEIQKMTVATNYARTHRQRTLEDMGGQRERNAEFREEAAIKIQKLLLMRRSSEVEMKRLYKDAERIRSEEKEEGTATTTEKKGTVWKHFPLVKMLRVKR